MQIKALDKLQRFASERKGQIFLALTVLAISFLIRLLLFRYHGYYIDENCFKAWYNTAADSGLRSFYDSTWCDYPPFNIYIFWIFGNLAHAVGHLDFLIKLPQNLFDLATAYLIFSFVRSRYSFLPALSIMSIYAFNPAVIFNLAVWGQFDSIYTFFMVASLYTAMRSKYELSGGLFAFAILTKPQSVVLLPVLAYVILKNGRWKRAISSSVVCIAMIFLIILPFHWNNPVTFLVDRYSGYSVYPYNSINAYNFWALQGFWNWDGGGAPPRPDMLAAPHSFLGLSYQIWGILGFIILAAFTIRKLHRKYDQKAAVFAVFLLMFGFFMLMTRMHERYLFPVFALLAMILFSRQLIAVYSCLTITFLANLVYVLSILKAGTFISDGHWSLYVLVSMNAILFFYSILIFWKMQKRKLATEVPKTKKETQPPPKIVPGKSARDSQPTVERMGGETASSARGKLSRWWHIIILATLVITFFSTAVWNLGDRHYPSSDFVPQNDPEEVTLDLGNSTRVDKVYLLVQSPDSADVDLYWGTPESWNLAGNLKSPWTVHSWQSVNLGQDTEYVRLVFKGKSGRIGEVAVLQNDSKLTIKGISTSGNTTNAQALIDEQQLVGNPGSASSGTYFDEIYYVWSAEQYLNLHQITDWQSQTNWDHPPLSRIIIAASIAIFGHNPFAWRIMGVIFTAMAIVFVFLLARRMFGTPRAGLIAAFLLTFDCMHFAQARITTPDTYLFFFFAGMVYFFYRYWADPVRGGKYLFWSLVFLGLGFSTKWFVMYGFVGLMILLVILKIRERKIRQSELFWFAGGTVAAVSIYMLSYLPYFIAPLENGGLSNWWKIQLDMFSFHAHLTATHAASSPWYTWPLMLNPVWFYAGYFPATRAYIASFGNPALWWASIPIMIPTVMVVINWLANSMKNKVANFITRALRPLWREVGHRREVALFIIIPFLTQWLFFAPVGRVVFIYHFYPCLIFVILAITLWIEWLWTRFKWGKWVVGGYLALNVACFIFFFPAISGLPMSNGYWDSLQWMVHWIW